MFPFPGLQVPDFNSMVHGSQLTKPWGHALQLLFQWKLWEREVGPG